MDRRDLRSVLRLFAEIASSVNDEGAPAPDYEGAAQGGEECLSALDGDALARPTAPQ
jgi:hypothetical protein